MSEDSNKPPSINLEELERQLREALSRRSTSSDSAPHISVNDDPLSILTRLIEHEGANNQAQSKPVLQTNAPSYAPQDAARHDPQAGSYQDPGYQQPTSWQPYQEQSPAEPANTYQANDHLVFDPNRSAVLADHYAIDPRAVPSESSYTPYVPQTPPSAPYQSQQTPEFEHAPPQYVSADSTPYYGDVAAHRDTQVPAPPPAPTEAPRDYLAQSQRSPDLSAFQPSGYDPSRMVTATHDMMALSPSEIRPVSDAYALNAIYGQSRPSQDKVPEQPASSGYAFSPTASPPSDQHSAADRAKVFAAAFPDRTTQSSQWTNETPQGVVLSYSEAEANLGSDQRPAEPPQKSQGKGVMILLGLVVVMAGGFGLAAYMRNEGARVPSGPPPMISADKNPVKVVPSNPGGTEVPNQGAAIYQPSKAEDAKDAKVISTDEKPVDISAASRPPGSPMIGEPKKIRTVTVRLDGSLVEENTVPAGSPVPNSAAVPRAAPSMLSIQPPSVSQPVSPPQTAAAPPANPPAVPSQANTVRVLPPSRPQAAEPAAAPPPAVPQAVVPPARTPQPVSAAPAPVDTAEREPTGDYGVQFSAPATEGEARNAIAALKRSYATIVDGMTFAAQKAENNGRTIFRVRAIGLSREEAISVCEKIKSTGGQCFVARN